MTTHPLTHNLVHFARYLRAQGMRVVPETTVALVGAARAVGLEERDDVYAAFRAVTVVRHDEEPIFDAAFELFFGDERRIQSLDSIELNIHDRPPKQLTAVSRVIASEGGEGEGSDVSEQLGASAVERLARRDFSELSVEEYAQVQQLIARMVWQPAEARSRRTAPAARGTRPHLRRTLRQLVGPGRDLMPLAMAAPKPRRRPLLVLADISGSMERYTEMLLYFVHAARGRLGRVEAFVFSTRLSRITRELRHRDPKVALRQVGGVVHDWASGTLIGSSFSEFNTMWSRRVTRGGPVALIISDGWDRGDPGLLRLEMAKLARNVHRVIWLNPLAGREGYAPEVRGLRTALPFVDDFMPAANLEDLSAVVRLLESVPKRKEAG